MSPRPGLSLVDARQIAHVPVPFIVTTQVANITRCIVETIIIVGTSCRTGDDTLRTATLSFSEDDKVVIQIGLSWIVKV